MQSLLSPLELSLLVLQTLKKILNEGTYDPNKVNENALGLHNYFVAAFSSSKVSEKRDSEFVLDLVEKIGELLADNAFTEDSLKYFAPGMVDSNANH